MVQLGLYMALLREGGVPCHRGQLLYRKNRHRTEVPWSDALERFIHAVVLHARHTAGLLGMAMPLTTRNVPLRRAQFRTADDPARGLAPTPNRP